MKIVTLILGPVGINHVHVHYDASTVQRLQGLVQNCASLVEDGKA